MSVNLLSHLVVMVTSFGKIVLTVAAWISGCRGKSLTWLKASYLLRCEHAQGILLSFTYIDGRKPLLKNQWCSEKKNDKIFFLASYKDSHFIYQLRNYWWLSSYLMCLLTVYVIHQAERQFRGKKCDWPTFWHYKSLQTLVWMS